MAWTYTLALLDLIRMFVWVMVLLVYVVQSGAYGSKLSFFAHPPAFPLDFVLPSRQS